VGRAQEPNPLSILGSSGLVPMPISSIVAIAPETHPWNRQCPQLFTSSVLRLCLPRFQIHSNRSSFGMYCRCGCLFNSYPVFLTHLRLLLRPHTGVISIYWNWKRKWKTKALQPVNWNINELHSYPILALLTENFASLCTSFRSLC